MPVNTVVGLQNAMGEFGGPRRHSNDHRAEAKERFVRRLEGYRRHHVNSLNKFDNYMNSVYEQQRQDTRILHQNWIESRTKKASKVKLSRHNVNNSTSTTTSAQKLQKQKLDPHTQSVTTNLDNAKYSHLPVTTVTPSVETSSVQIDSQPRNNVNSSGNSGSLLVNIAVDANLQRTQSEITLKFSSTLSNSGTVQRKDQDCGITVTTSDSCKAENAIDVPLKTAARSPPNLTSDQIDIGDIDGLSDFFMEADDDFFKNLDFDSECDYGQDNKLPLEPSNCLVGEVESQRENTSCQSIGAAVYGNGMLPTGNYTDPMYGLEMVVTTNPQGLAPVTPVARSSMEPCVAGAAPPTPTLLGDTGPAAETLKQMAAQHQSLENAQYIGMQPHPTFGSDGFSNRFQPANVNGGCYLPRYTQRGYTVPQSVYGVSFGGLQGHPGPATDISMATYQSGRMLSHYSDQQAVPSSLQQLENQVQSHFSGHGTSPAPHLASNQLQPTDMHPASQFHMPQTQQMNIQVGQGQHLSLSQQQSIGLMTECQGQSGVSINTSDRVKMQQTYQSQQQQSFNPYAGGMPYPMQNYQNTCTSRRPCGNGAISGATSASHHQNLTMNKAINQAINSLNLPVDRSLDQKNIYSASPSSMQKGAAGFSSDEQHVLANRHGLPTVASYCMSAKQDESYSSSLMKRGHRAPNVVVRPNSLSIMGQRTQSSNDWSSVDQQRQMLAQQHVGLPVCDRGSYDGCPPLRYRQSVNGTVQMPMNQMTVSVNEHGLANPGALNQGMMNQNMAGQGHVNQSVSDQGAVNQGLVNQSLVSHTWLSASPMHVPQSHMTMHANQQQNLNVHHGLAPTMMAARTGVMLSQENVHSRHMTSAMSHCYVPTDRQGEVQSVDFIRTQNGRTVDCHGMLPQLMIDSSLSSLF